MARDIGRPLTWGDRPPPFAAKGDPMSLDKRPTHAVKRDGRDGIKVDPIVLALHPPVSDKEALILDRVLAEGRSGRGGLRVAAEPVAKMLGVPENEAAAIVAGLCFKRLIVDFIDPMGFADGVRPGPALTN